MKKKGFTLIELLAVIVILAVIALIVTPIVTSIIAQAKVSANARSVEGHIKDVQYTILEVSFKENGNINKYDGTYPVNNVKLIDKLESDGYHIQDSDKIECSTYTVANGTVTEATGCTETGWGKTYNYTNTGGAVVSGGGNSQTAEPLAIGTDIDYSTTLNGVTLDNWKVFLSDANYTYLIYGDYLPTSAVVVQNNIYLVGNYEVGYSGRSNFVNYLLNKANWSSLLVGTLNGNNINYVNSESSDAMGSPTIELWVNSWNQNNGYKHIYEFYDVTQWCSDDTSNEYYFSFINDRNDWNDEIDLSSESGYNNKLYFPYNNLLDNNSSWKINGYWLSGSNAGDCGQMTMVYYDGSVGPRSSDGALRPVIKLPTSVVNQ